MGVHPPRTTSETIHDQHRTLLHRLAEQTAAVTAGYPGADLEALVAFLKGEVLDHAIGDERHLYPLVEPLLKAYGRATATMSADHEVIAEYVRQIEQTARTLRTAGPDRQGTGRSDLLRLLTELGAVLRVHMEKEERIYLPLFEKYVPDEGQRRVLNRMHEGREGHREPAMRSSIDVRWIAPHRRPVLLCELFEALAPGEAVMLVDDRDPGALCTECQIARAGQLVWEYLEKGPPVWRVRISKV